MATPVYGFRVGTPKEPPSQLRYPPFGPPPKLPEPEPTKFPAAAPLPANFPRLPPPRNPPTVIPVDPAVLPPASATFTVTPLALRVTEELERQRLAGRPPTPTEEERQAAIGAAEARAKVEANARLEARFTGLNGYMIPYDIYDGFLKLELQDLVEKEEPAKRKKKEEEPAVVPKTDLVGPELARIKKYLNEDKKGRKPVGWYSKSGTEQLAKLINDASKSPLATAIAGIEPFNINSYRLAILDYMNMHSDAGGFKFTDVGP